MPLLLVLGALGLLYALHAGGIERSLYVSSLAEWSVDPPAADAASRTGYAEGWRRAISPGDFKPAYSWIADTQDMLVAGDWRVRQTTADNAPHGREVHEASPYRWLLVAGAAVDRLISGRPWPLAIEHAALWINPLLHLLFVALVGVSATRAAGAVAGAGVTLLAAMVFPLATSFAGGAPSSQPLFLLALAASVLALMRGVAASRPVLAEASWRWFVFSGLTGALAMWLHAADFLPLLLAIGVGALAAGWLQRRGTSVEVTASPAGSWRWWGCAGGVGCLIAYAVEYAPELWVWRLDVIHPWYALGWIALGEMLVRVEGGAKGGAANRGNRVALALCGGIVATVVVVTVVDGGTIVTGTAHDLRLSPVLSVAASSMAAWIRESGGSLVAAATLAPVLVWFAALGMARSKDVAVRERSALVLLLIPAAVAIVLAMTRLRGWAAADAVVLCVLIQLVRVRRSSSGARTSVGAWAMAGVVVLFSAAQAFSLARSARDRTLASSEAVALLERDFAHWLDFRAGETGAIVLAPPEMTVALAYYGSVRGLGTMAWENREGLNAAVRIAAASSPEEAHTLLTARGVTHIVMPSWEPFLEHYARLGQGEGAANNSLIGALRQWSPPGWLRPIPYSLPKVEGFANESIAVFELVEEPAPAVAKSRLVEYFLETGNSDSAVAAARALVEFPSDPAAVAAAARIAAARNDGPGFARAIADLESLLESDAMYFLPWDRRVSVALTLARASRLEAAGKVLEPCLTDMDEAALRSLTSGSLQLFLQLCRRLEQPITDPALEELAFRLLPPAARERLR